MTSAVHNDHLAQPSACIVIPAYKSFGDLYTNEVISLTQCLRVLRNYPIILAGPESLDWTGYKELFGKNDVLFRAQNFSNHFFDGIEGYNRLMMNIDFYKTFSEFEYMLVYQTDCFVFRDELKEWCAYGYDYIGAPWIGINMAAWFQSPWYPRELAYMYTIFGNMFVQGAGNGGLSLRKISSIVRNLQRFKKAAKNWKAYEDGFYSHYAGTFNPFFRIPATKKALAFSFDSHPEQAYQLNNNKLPFGCHAWFRSGEPHYEQNLLFWEPIIKKFII